MRISCKGATLSKFGAALALLGLPSCRGLHRPNLTHKKSSPPKVKATPLRVVDGYRLCKKLTAAYTVNGIRYQPLKVCKLNEVGIASFYGDKNHGRRTACGEVFDENQLTGAHRYLPLPSIVIVTNLSNGKKIKLRINDRGPFKKNRILDVSVAAAKALGFHKKGITRVHVQALTKESERCQRRVPRYAPLERK